ncbi:MAG: hypothetical protein J7J98_03980, partial [candidate division Zixibacteria bacterium]|nr:hypothetical protein [candidate division Zixibacteria bacterium]
RAVLVRELQTMFDQGSEREMLLPKPNIPRSDSRLSSSHFWDFDILDPKIEIRGDSAIVDCELVLWAGPTSNLSRGRGVRVTERFVFVSPRVEKSFPTGAGQFQTFDTKSNPSGTDWQLAELSGLLDLLEMCTTTVKYSEK